MQFSIILSFLFVISLSIGVSPREEDGASLYNVLGVSRDASQREIRTAYKRLAKEWHPDKNKSPQAPEKIIEINKAYETLSDEEARRRYDVTGETDPAPSGSHGHGHAHHQGFTFFQAGNGFFHFSGFGHSGPRTDTITTHHFQNVVLPETTHKLWLLYFFGDFCMQCSEVSKVWDSIKEEMQLNGIGMASVHVSHHYYIASYCNVERIPTLVAIVNKRVFHFSGTLQSRSIRSFVKNNLPSWTISEVSGSSIKEFIDDSIARNKPRIILFSPHSQPSLLFKSVAFSNHQSIDFAFSTTDKISGQSPSLLQTFNISYRSKKLLVFKEYSQPSTSLEGNEVTGKALRELVRGLRLDLPRLTSPQIIDQICGNDDRFCLILLVQGSEVYNDSITSEFRANAVKISASNPNIGLAYIDGNTQQEFISCFPPRGKQDHTVKIQCENSLQPRNVLLLRRKAGFQARYNWYSDYCGSHEDFSNLLSFIKQTSLKTTTKLVPDLTDEFAPGFLESMWTLICEKYFQIYDYFGAHSQTMSLLLMTFFMAAMLCCASMIGASQTQEPPKQRLKRVEKQKPSKNSSLLVIQELTHELYRELVEQGSRGSVTILTLVNSIGQNKDPGPLVSNLFARRRKRQREHHQKVHYLWASLEQFDSWLEDLLTESNMDTLEAETRMSHCLADNAKSSVFVLVLFGSRKQFSIFPEISTNNNCNGVQTIQTPAESVEGSEFSERRKEDSDLGSESGEMERRLGLWLDRLEDGSLKRYSVRCWPDCPE